MSADTLPARVHEARAAVRHHKSEIRKHREGLQTAAAKLEELERECRRRGIKLVVNPGVGDRIHGHTADTARTEP